MKSHVEEDVLQCTRTAAALRDQLCYMVPYRGRRIGCWTVPATIDETSTASFLCLSPISPLSTFPPPPPPPPPPSPLRPSSSFPPGKTSCTPVYSITGST